jgi:glycosyltransferase involved in cell wall biosynthesis
VTPSPAVRRLIWIYPGAIDRTLDAATWLRTVEELRNSGWDVTLVSAGPAGSGRVRGVDVFCIPSPDVYFLRQVVYHLRVLRLLWEDRATTDAVVFHEGSAPWLLPARAFGRLLGHRRPLWIMDTRSLPMPSPVRSSWRDKARARAYALGFWLGNRYADGRLAITRRMAKAARIPAGKLWGVWPSGTDTELFAAAKSRRKWPGLDNPVHIVYHGVLHFERNLMTLCRAVARANAEGTPFILSLVGDGTERTALEEFAARSGGSIRVLPPLPHSEIPALLASAHLGALPFPDEEKFRVSSPIKLFEYMAAGLPLLLTPVSCHTDVVGRGDYAFWTEGADEAGLLAALRAAWASRGELSAMGERASAAAREWTWEASARKLRNALEEGLSSREASIKPGHFVFSLDLELAWGTLDWGRFRSDKTPRDAAKERKAVRRLLDMMDEFGIAATWAVTGHLFYERCEECRTCPLSAFKGKDSCYEKIWGTQAPMWYGSDIVDMIVSSGGGHEIACHGYMHRLFEGMSRAEAEFEVREWLRLAGKKGIAPRTVIFPQGRIGHLPLFLESGFICFRGRDVRHPAFAVPLLGKALNRLNLFLSIMTPQVYDVKPGRGGLVNIPSSQWLFRTHPRIERTLDALGLPFLRLQGTLKAIGRASATGKTVHLWIHPHELKTEQDWRRLRHVFARVAEEAAKGGLRSTTMGDLAGEALHSARGRESVS